MALRLRSPSSLLRVTQDVRDVAPRRTPRRRPVDLLTSATIRPRHLRRQVLPQAAQTEPSEVQQTPSVEEKKEWIALIANAEFMLHDVQNESLAEQLREKVRHYGSKEMEVDFFLVPEPQWLDAQYPEKAKLVGRPCVALVSPDHVWMRFMKTRLDQVLEIRLGDMPKEEVLKAAGEIPDFEKPEIWRAPYSPYSPGWWKAFYPKEKTEEEGVEEEGVKEE